MTEEKKDKPIIFSKFTEALLTSLHTLKHRTSPDDLSKLTVSQTVSFFGILYERVRNAIEYREDHLIRRAAIERILRRRFSLNPEGKGEGENLLRELLWARYFNNGSLGGEDIINIQQIIDKYLLIKKQIVVGRNIETQRYLAEFIFQMLTAEIEENLSPEKTGREANFTFFIYQVLRGKIKIEGLTEEQKDTFFLAAIEKAYRRTDKPFQRYHFFITFYQPINKYTVEELKTLALKIPDIFKKIDEMITSPYVDKLLRYTKKQLPSFLILFDIVKTKFGEIGTILSNPTKLWNEVELTCRKKYQAVATRMRVLGVRSFIYIFLTKMLFALILEYPLSLYIYGEINTVSIIINSIFPPVLMLLIISFFKLPGEDNTQRIYKRIIDIIDKDKSFETKVAFMPKKSQSKRPILIFGFTIFYSLTFIVTLAIIYELLSLLKFNLISQLIFIFFVSVVTFFSYRIKQIVSEYRLEEKESVFAPIVDFFFMPVLSLGKFFSSELARLNFFIVIFDFLIEAPFKFIFEIVEEWISFVRKRKEEII